MVKTKIIKGDIVRIVAGSHKGHQGPITKFSKDRSRVFIEGLNQIKHVKPSQQDQEGGIREVPKSVNISNVAIIDPKNKEKTSKIGYLITNDKKVRIAKKSNAQLK